MTGQVVPDFTPADGSPPKVQLYGEGDGEAMRLLLTFRWSDGGLVAEYDPADLDAAAQVFVEHVLKMRPTPEGAAP